MSPQGILILGSAGFLGTSLISRLRKSKQAIYTISTRSCLPTHVPGANTYITSLDDKKTLSEVLPRCNIVFYFASHSTPGFSAHRPSIEAESNLLPCLRFLEILEKYKDTLLVYLSSGGAVYGDSLNNTNSENLPLKPLSYYGAGKAAIEKFLLAYQSQTGNKVLILRPSNIYGPGQTFREGFGIIPTVYKKIIENRPVSIWGDGKNVRDYLYIDDFIDLCQIIITKRTTPSYRRRIYNVGAGQGISLNNLLNLMEKTTNLEIHTEFKKIRGVDVRKNVLDYSRIREDYKWEVKNSLETGLEKTWSWFQEMYS